VIFFLPEAINFGLGPHEIHQTFLSRADDLFDGCVIKLLKFFPLEIQVRLHILIEIWLEIIHNCIFFCNCTVLPPVQWDGFSITIWLHSI
jgi:hypothetical protein